MRARAGVAAVVALLTLLTLSACGWTGSNSVTDHEAERLNAAAETLDLNSVSIESPTGQDELDNEQQEENAQ